MYHAPDYVWAHVLVGVVGIAATTSVTLSWAAASAQVGRRVATGLAVGAGVLLGGWIAASWLLARAGLYRLSTGAAAWPWLGLAFGGFLVAVLLATRIPVVSRALSQERPPARLALPHSEVFLLRGSVRSMTGHGATRARWPQGWSRRPGSSRPPRRSWWPSSGASPSVPSGHQAVRGGPSRRGADRRHAGSAGPGPIHDAAARLEELVVAPVAGSDPPAGARGARGVTPFREARPRATRAFRCLPLSDGVVAMRRAMFGNRSQAAREAVS
jgi:hypothetical protein